MFGIDSGGEMWEGISDLGLGIAEWEGPPNDAVAEGRPAARGADRKG